MTHKAPPLTDAERASYWQSIARHYKDIALRLQQELQAAKRVPENLTGRTITYSDKTGNIAAARADRER